MSTKTLFYAMTIFIVISKPIYAESQVGKTAFDNNCKACHDLKTSVVGPSLVEINKSYPATKEEAFLVWTMNPGRKRPEGIQMPSMSHVGEKSLKDIHQYILRIAKDVKVDKKRNNFTFKPPAPRYPRVQRGFMPFASPASIAVVLNQELGLNWDAAINRIRYAYIGNKPFFSGENKREQRQKDVLYWETSKQLWSFAQDDAFSLQGYRLKGELPEFIYQVGDITINERISQGESAKTFHRTYSLVGISSAFTMDLSHQGQAELTSSAGSFDGQILHLNVAEATHFTLTVRLP